MRRRRVLQVPAAPGEARRRGAATAGRGRIEAAAGIPALVVDDPLRCVVRGAAEILEHGDELADSRAAAES